MRVLIHLLGGWNILGMTVEKSKMLAGHIFAHTSHYDSLVNSWMHEDSKSKPEQEQRPRYGENHTKRPLSLLQTTHLLIS